MSFGNEPNNITEGIRVHLQQQLLPAVLNPDSYQNVNVLLRWASEEFMQTPDAVPEVVGAVLKERALQKPQSLIWDVPPDATPAPVVLTKAQLAEKAAKQAQDFEKRELLRRLEEQKQNSNPDKFLEDHAAQNDKQKRLDQLAKDIETSKNVRKNAIMNFAVYGVNRGAPG
jgi:hypothetical protein